MAHDDGEGIYLFAAQGLGQVRHALEVEILLFYSQQVEQSQGGLAGTGVFQPHVDGGKFELLQFGDIAIGAYHYGKRLGMSGEQGS